MSDSRLDAKRRDVLKAAASGAVTAIAVTGTTSASADETIAFSELSSEAKSAFRTALNEGTYVDRELPSTLSKYQFVSYQGATYELNYLHVRDEQPDKLSVTEVSASAVPEEATVLETSDLPTGAVSTLEKAQTAPVESPQKVAYEANDRYVRLGNRVYHVGVLKQDAPLTPAIAPTKVGGEN